MKSRIQIGAFLRAALLLLIAGAGLTCVAPWPQPLSAQSINPPFSETFTDPAGTPTAKKTFVVQNNNQVGHTVVIVYGLASAHCETIFQGSEDNANFITLDSLPNINGNSPIQLAYANGYFPYLQIVTNALNDSSCTTSITVTYTGYYTPITYIPPPLNQPIDNVSTMSPLISTALITYPLEEILEGFSCYNPGTATAYLQISDSTNQLLGSYLLYQVGIPANTTVVNSTPFVGGNELGAGAATAVGGTTAVTTPLVCNFQLNINGPFGAFEGSPNFP